MANIGPYLNVPYYWQGISLHCWLNAIEMLMGWKYNNRYGQETNAAGLRVNRAAHTPGAIHARDHNWGSSPATHANDYGLQQISIGASLASFQTALRARGPILASGRYGPARSGVGGHVILIVGWSNTNKLCYHDPFLIGWKAAVSNHLTYMTPIESGQRVFAAFGLQSYFAARWNIPLDNPANQPVTAGAARGHTNF